MTGELHRVDDDLALLTDDDALGELLAWEARMYLRRRDDFERWLRLRGRA